MTNAKKSSLKTALILSGGGARGAFEAGVLKVILKKIQPDLIIGTSVGSLNAASVALGFDTNSIEEYWLKLRKKDTFKVNPLVFRKFFKADSIYSSKVWNKKVNEIVKGKIFSDCKIPLYINATRLRDGEGVFFQKRFIRKSLYGKHGNTTFFCSLSNREGKIS